MVWLIAILLFLAPSIHSQTITETFGSGPNQFQIEFVIIKNENNSPDQNGLGSVSYTYNIGKYEISRDQALRASSSGITVADMGYFANITGQTPATGITWNEAAKYVNWMNTSSGFQPAYKINQHGSPELWSALDYGYNPNNRFRNIYAKYFLPSADEWYKAAFSSPSGGWTTYATASDQAPTAVFDGLSGVVYQKIYQNGPAPITNAGALSAWGTMAQSGNVQEWTESAFDGTNNDSSEAREIRGGHWYSSTAGAVSSSSRTGLLPYSDSDSLINGFRVAMVPEPSTVSLIFAFGILCYLRPRIR